MVKGDADRAWVFAAIEAILWVRRSSSGEGGLSGINMLLVVKALT